MTTKSIALIAADIVDRMYFVPKGKVDPFCGYSSSKDRWIIPMWKDVFEMTTADAPAVMNAVRDIVARDALKVEATGNWLSHVLMRTGRMSGAAGHARRDAWRAKLVADCMSA